MGEISPHSRAQVCSCPPLVIFMFSLHLLHIFYEFHGCFEEFSSLDQSFGSLETQGVVSSHLQVRARTNPRSSRGSDPRNRGV
ncbi:hypothetical protein MANES_17G023847v8 [Manihot esculenta]|uniref:Uncharacterized protein n=1 Tax=Manihot esculenta TaxID=3983 RepID=A0ACB7G202_MANES|nr:hypothetical protein MANES_17G023847v8 [Manihot esculenta]